MYQALYRKWRSRTFDQVVGQGHITETLKRQVDSSRLSHAYLFTGTRGTGKTSCAKLLARAVNCQQPDHGNPCNCCPACVGIENGSILDVMELDAASNNRVDDIRAILDEAVYAPAAVKKRVYIIDEVHTLSAQAFNALLQTLEEPPEHLMFILATTELHKVPATIKSRCQQFAFKRIQSGEIARHLEYVAQQEGFTLTPEGAGLIARLADGGMRDALSLLDQCLAGGGTVDEGRVFSALGLAGNLETAALLDTLADGNGEDALARLARLYDGGKEIAALCGELSTLLRDLLVRKTAPQAGASLMTGGYDEATMSRLAQRFDVPRLVQMLRVVQQTGADLARSSNRRTDMELCLITLATPALDSSAGGLAARVARLEAGGSQASGMPAAAPAPVLQAEGRERERRGQKVTAKVTAPPPAVHQTPPPWAEPPVKAQPAPPAEEVPWEEPPVKAQPAPPAEEVPWEEPPVEAQPAPPAEEVPWEEPPVKAQPAPPVEEVPWEEPPLRAAPPSPAAQAVKAEAAAPAAPSPGEAGQRMAEVQPQAEPPVVPVQEGMGGWPGWEQVRGELRGMLSHADYSMMCTSAMAEGRWDGTAVTIWGANEFVVSMLDMPAPRQAVAQVAARYLGRQVPVVFRVGTAPADAVTQPQPAVPPEGDALEAFIARNAGNIVVE